MLLPSLSVMVADKSILNMQETQGMPPYPEDGLHFLGFGSKGPGTNTGLVILHVEKWLAFTHKPFKQPQRHTTWYHQNTRARFPKWRIKAPGEMDMVSNSKPCWAVECNRVLLSLFYYFQVLKFIHKQVPYNRSPNDTHREVPIPGPPSSYLLHLTTWEATWACIITVVKKSLKKSLPKSRYKSCYKSCYKSRYKSR